MIGLLLSKAASGQPTIYTTKAGERPGQAIPDLGHAPETRVNICIRRPPFWVFRSGRVQAIWMISRGTGIADGGDVGEAMDQVKARVRDQLEKEVGGKAKDEL